MRITPLDVRKQEFRRVVRGLDADEVNAFLATVADEYEVALTDNKNLRERVIELDEKVAEYRNMERTLRDTLITAERVMSEARQNAGKEAELILRDAQLKANEEISGIASKVEGLRTQMRELRGHRDSFLARLQSLSEAQVGLVDSYRQDFSAEDSRLASMVDEVTDDNTDEWNDTTPVEEIAAENQWDESPTEPECPAVPSAPVEHRTETAHAAPAEDQWRGYDVGSNSRAVPRVNVPTEQPRTETHLAHPQEIQENVAMDEVSEALNVFNESSENIESVPEYGPQDYTEPAQAEYTPTSAHAGESHYSPAQSSEAAPGGQWSQPVAPYPDASPEMSNPEQAETVAGDPNVSANPDGSQPESPGDSTNPEDQDSSRWSLSRFTKGLASF